MADLCCALTANVPANLQICRTKPKPESEGSGSGPVRVRHIDGFGSVLPKMWVLVRFVRFGFGSIPISTR